MENITFKGVYLRRYTYWLIVLGLITLVLIFTLFDIPKEDRLIWATCLIGLETYFVFYLIRFDPKVIRIEKDEFEITYRNTSFFKKEDSVYLKNDIEVAHKQDILILSNATTIVCKIRKKELTNEDWETLTNYFL